MYKNNNKNAVYKIIKISLLLTLYIIIFIFQVPLKKHHVIQLLNTRQYHVYKQYVLFYTFLDVERSSISVEIICIFISFFDILNSFLRVKKNYGNITRKRKK